MKGSRRTEEKVHAGKHARVTTRAERPSVKERRGWTNRTIACVCTVILTVSLIPTAAMMQAFADSGDITINSTYTSQELSPASKGPVDLNSYFTAWEEDSEEASGLIALGADDGDFSFAIITPLEPGDESRIVIEDGNLKLKDKPSGDYTSGLSISVTWNGKGDYAEKTATLDESITVASGDFGSDKTYTITRYNSVGATVTLGGSDGGGEADLLDVTPTPIVKDYFGYDVSGQFSKGVDYTVEYAAAARADGSETPIEVVGTTVKAKGGQYAAGSDFGVTATYTFIGDKLENNVDLGSGGDSAFIGVNLNRGLNPSAITLGDIDDANTGKKFVAKDDTEDDTGVWYVRNDKSLVVPITIEDIPLYSNISSVYLRVDEKAILYEGDLTDLNTNHEGELEITISPEDLSDIGEADTYGITAVITTTDDYTVTSGTLTSIQVVDREYSGPTIEATFDGGNLVEPKYYDGHRTLDIKVTPSTLKVPIKADGAEVSYKTNGKSVPIQPKTTDSNNLTYQQIALGNGNYDFTESFDDAIVDIWGQKIDIVSTQDPLAFIVDTNVPIAEMFGVGSGLLDAFTPFYKAFIKEATLPITLKGSVNGYSGIKSVEYAILEKGDLDLDGGVTIPALTTIEWKSLSDTSSRAYVEVKDGDEVKLRSGIIDRGVDEESGDDEFVIYLRVEANNGKEVIIASDGTIVDTMAPTYEDWKFPAPVPVAYNENTPIYDDKAVSGFSIDVYDPNTKSSNPGGKEALGSGLKRAWLGSIDNIVDTDPSDLQTEPDSWSDGLTSDAISGRNLDNKAFSITADEDYNDIQLDLKVEDFAGNEAAIKVGSFSIDTTAPVINDPEFVSPDNTDNTVINGFEFVSSDDINVNVVEGVVYCQPGVTVRFTVTDANLDPKIGEGVEVVKGSGNKTDILTTPKLIPELSSSAEDGKVTYTYEIKFPDEGIYEFAIEAIDLLGAAGAEGHVATSDTTGVFYVDGTPPEVTTVLPDPVYTSGDGTRYYDAQNNPVEAIVTIDDMSFDPRLLDDADAPKPMVNGVEVDFVGGWESESIADSLLTRWTSKVDVSGDGDYQLTINAMDLAGNENTPDNKNAVGRGLISDTGDLKILNPGANSGKFIIDTTAPEISIALSRANNSVDNVGYYQQGVMATITVSDRNFDPALANIQTSPGGSSINWQRIERGDSVGTIAFNDVVDNYSFTVSLQDIARNRTTSAPSGVFTIDHTDPAIEVSFDSNNGNTSGGVEYYNANRTATIRVVEHNFDSRAPEYVNFQPTGPSVGSPSFNVGGDVHTATVSYNTENTAANTYDFSIVVRDRSGRTATYDGVTPFVVDTTAPTVEFTDAVQNMQAYNDVVTPTVLLTDANYDSNGKSFAIKGVKTSGTTPAVGYAAIADGEQGVVEDAARTPEADDIYTVTAGLADLAGNTSEATLTYSVNRFGSTWYIDGSTKDLVENRYTNEGQKVAIREVNVNEVNEYDVSIAREGTLTTLTSSDFSVSKTGDDTTWKENTYNLPASLFEEEGVYEITVSTTDAASNTSSNRAPRVTDSACPVDFVIDKTAPTVVITGVEENGSYNEEARNAVIDVQDNIALDSIDIYLNDGSSPTASYTAEDMRAGSGKVSYPIEADGTMQMLTAIAFDAAGNESDEVVVSNIFVNPDPFLHFFSQTPLAMFVSNPPLLYAIVAFTTLVLLAAIGGLAWLLVRQLRKDGDKQKPSNPDIHNKATA